MSENPPATPSLDTGNNVEASIPSGSNPHPNTIERPRNQSQHTNFNQNQLTNFQSSTPRDFEGATPKIK